MRLSKSNVAALRSGRATESLQLSTRKAGRSHSFHRSTTASNHYWNSLPVFHHKITSKSCLNIFIQTVRRADAPKTMAFRVEHC